MAYPYGQYPIHEPPPYPYHYHQLNYNSSPYSSLQQPQYQNYAFQQQFHHQVIAPPQLPSYRAPVKQENRPSACSLVPLDIPVQLKVNPVANRMEPKTGRARLKFSPRLPEHKKKPWMAEFNKLHSPTKDIKPDENNKWDLSQFPSLKVVLTRLPTEIAEIYFAKSKRATSSRPLVYVVPTPLRTAAKMVYSARKDPKPVKKKKPVIKIKMGKQHIKNSIENMKTNEKKRKKQRKRCNFCGKIKRSADLLKHKTAVYSVVEDVNEQINSDHSRASCSSCHTKLCSSVALKLHKQHVHSNSDVKFTCFVCLMSFNSQALLAFHLQVHYVPLHQDEENKIPPGISVIQSKGSGSSPSLKGLKKLRLYSCNICKKAFSCRQKLSSHLKSHAIRCEICNKAFSKRNMLKAHLLVHKNDSPYSCTECCKTFRFKSSLNVHLSLHQSKSYKCKLCKDSFRTNVKLISHVNSVHHLTMTEKCPACDKLFLDRHSLNSHWKLYHTKMRSQPNSPLKITELTDSEQQADDTPTRDPFCELDQSVVAEVESIMANLLNSSVTPIIDHNYDGDRSPVMSSSADQAVLEAIECPLCEAISLSSSDISDHLLSFHRVNKKKLCNLKT